MTITHHDTRNRFLRVEESRPYCEERLPASFLHFVETEILPSVELRGYNLDAKRRTIAHMIRQLYMARKMGRVIGDTRNKNFCLLYTSPSPRD